MPLTIAILGCGKRGTDKVGWAIGHCHAEAWLAVAPGSRLLGVDPNPDNLAAFGERFKLPPENLFPSTTALYAATRPDCVSVCTWPSLHAPQVHEAVAHGVRGIVCEKPAALDPGQIAEMIAACDQAGVRLAIAHQRRHEPHFARFRELARTAIGTPRVLEMRIAGGWDLLSWAVHWFDLAAWVFDAPAQRVLAGIDYTAAERYGHAIDDATVMRVDFPGDAQAVLITGAPEGDTAALTARGENGFVQLRGNDLHLWNHEGYRVEKFTPDWMDGFKGLMRELVAALGTQRPMLCDATHNHRATELAYAAHESARTRRVVELPMLTRFAPLDVLAHPARPLPELAGPVVLWADAHFGSGGREGLAEALTALTGHAPRIVNAEERVLTAADLADASALVVYHTQSEPAPETVAALTDWVAAGKPLALVHAALGAYPKWDDYKKWCGRVWVWDVSEHPHEPSALAAASPAWPGFASGWIPKDEVFIKLGQTAPTEDLLTAKISSGTYPAAWRSKDWNNIAVWVPGHRRDIWTVPALREGLAATLRLALAGRAG